MYLTVAPCIIQIHYEQSFTPKTVTSYGYNDLLQSNNLIIQKSFCERLCAQRYKAQSPDKKQSYFSDVLLIPGQVRTPIPHPNVSLPNEIMACKTLNFYFQFDEHQQIASYKE